MPPLAGSRYGFCHGLRDPEGRLHLTDREPYRYRAHPDTRLHVVAEGETWFDLAGRYFAPLPRACGFWWAIADFQPEGSEVVDPTLALEPGAVVHVPSLRVLTDVILGEARRRDA